MTLLAGEPAGRSKAACGSAIWSSRGAVSLASCAAASGGVSPGRQPKLRRRFFLPANAIHTRLDILQLPLHGCSIPRLQVLTGASGNDTQCNHVNKYSSRRCRLKTVLLLDP